MTLPCALGKYHYDRLAIFQLSNTILRWLQDKSCCRSKEYWLRRYSSRYFVTVEFHQIELNVLLTFKQAPVPVLNLLKTCWTWMVTYRFSTWVRGGWKGSSFPGHVFISIYSFTQMCNKHQLHTLYERYIKPWGQRHQFCRNLQSK